MPLEKLIKGFQGFRSSYFESSNHYEKLCKGQTPETLVIACSDSRNDPALITQSEPGDIFVVRNVAAIVPPYQPDSHYHGTSAAIEFAVKSLKVKHIVVLGHALCGGVQSLNDDSHDHAEEFEFLKPWMSIGLHVKDMIDRILPAAPAPVKRIALEQAMVLSSVNNLLTFPWIKDAVDKGHMTLHGWYFDMVNGRLLAYDAASGKFGEMEDAGRGAPVRLKGT